MDVAHVAGHDPEPESLDERVRVHRLPAPAGPGYYLNAYSLRRLWSSLGPDVVHVHYASGYGTLARLSRVPYLLSVWGSDVYDYPYRNPRSMRIVRRNLRSAHALASTSECMADQVRRVMADPTAPVTVTPFGVDLARFDPGHRARRVSTQPLLIGNVKELAEHYGIEVLISAAGLLRDRNPSLPFEVRIYGEGRTRSDMEQRVVDLGLSGVVSLPGWIPHEDVPNALAQLDVFCATSLHESFGVAVVEAMAMRCAVVVSDVPGFTEVVGDAGLVVPIGDAEATAKALARLATDPSLRAALGEAGRRRVEAHYDWDANVDLVVRLYRRISANR